MVRKIRRTALTVTATMILSGALLVATPNPAMAIGHTVPMHVYCAVTYGGTAAADLIAPDTVSSWRGRLWAPTLTCYPLDMQAACDLQHSNTTAAPASSDPYSWRCWT